MAVIAERAGLSQPFISQLESGAHTPSLLTLYRIAAALDVMPGELFGSSPAPTGWVHHEPARISDSDTPHAPVATVLVPGGGGLLEAFEWEVSNAEDDQPGDMDWWQHDGEDFLYVITGSALLEVQGTTPIILNAGESGHLIETGQPHRWTPADRSGARVLLVVAYPSK